MKLCRFLSPEDIPSEVSGAGGTAPDPARPVGRAGVIEGGRVHEVASIFEASSRSGQSWEEAAVRLLAPVQPSKIVCVGRSYAEHAAELGNAVPKEPLIFLKPPSSVIGPEEPVYSPPGAEAPPAA